MSVISLPDTSYCTSWSSDRVQGSGFLLQTVNTCLPGLIVHQIKMWFCLYQHIYIEHTYTCWKIEGRRRMFKYKFEIFIPWCCPTPAVGICSLRHFLMPCWGQRKQTEVSSFRDNVDFMWLYKRYGLTIKLRMQPLLLISSQLAKLLLLCLIIPVLFT